MKNLNLISDSCPCSYSVKYNGEIYLFTPSDIDNAGAHVGVVSVGSDFYHFYVSRSKYFFLICHNGMFYRFSARLLLDGFLSFRGVAGKFHKLIYK